MSEQVRRKLKAAMQENARLKAEVERLRALDSLKTVSLTNSPTWNAIGAYAEVKEENARLKAEVERLTTDINRVQAQSDFYRSKLMNETAYIADIQLLDQVKHLEAQVERLTKAGDNLARGGYFGYGGLPLWEEWNKAKEGKQP